MNSEQISSQKKVRCSFNGSIFFYFYENSLHHLSVCIAEGLKELGIPFFSNINYWQISLEEEYLFQSNPDVSLEDCTIVVVNKDWLIRKDLATAEPHRAFWESLFNPKRKYIAVYLDDLDGFTLWEPDLGIFDLILRTHYNSKVEHYSNYIPWFFGLSNRVLAETSNLPDFQDRTRKLVVNYRVDQAHLDITNCWVRIDRGWIKLDKGKIIAEHPLRNTIRHSFFPLIQNVLPVENTVDSLESPPTDPYHQLQWKQTGGRHYPNYYQRLKQIVACTCFAGWLTPKSATGENIVEWWDTWRFWEALAAGCVAFHVDFEKYGIALPIMPENWRHYIGIDLDNVESAVERIADEPEILERISVEGRQWAIDNYSPVPTALRFIGLMSSHYVERELRSVNLALFPKWFESEEILSEEMRRVIKAIATHPHRDRIALFVDVGSNIEEVELILSGVAMNLLLQDDLEMSEVQISLVGQSALIQWDSLLTKLTGRISLEGDNEAAIGTPPPLAIASFAKNLPTYLPEELSQKQVIQLESGNWALG